MATASNKIEDRLYINGEFVPSIAGKKFDVFNPATEELSGSVYEALAEDVDVAVKAAQAAFPAWSALSADARASYVSRLADEIEKALAEISYLDAITMGKPVALDNLAAGHSVKALRYYASKANDICGDASLNTADFVNMSWRQPFGVCGAIIPWNGPLPMFNFKVGPALVAGNTMVLKSSEKAPLSILRVAQCAHDAGIPKGVLNILSGFGRPCGEAIAKHMSIRKISFTGSTATGRAIKKAAAESNLKNVTLELGGKSPLIVFEDADLERAIRGAAMSILLNSGQACIASSRVYVHASIAEDFIAGMKKAMTQMGQSANPAKADTMRGPQADKQQFDRVMSFLDHAKEENYTVVLGGNREHSKGYYIEPTILTNTPENSRVMKEEIFGSVVCINTFVDEEDVLALANDSEYGLYSSVYTRDISRAMRVAKRFEAGLVGVNCTSPTMAYDMPLGGWKGSGDGRELSRFGLDSWTELKSVFISL